MTLILQLMIRKAAIMDTIPKLDRRYRLNKLPVRLKVTKPLGIQ